MIKSMTGFGRGQETTETLEVTVEIRAVNHRYFEFSTRMPRNCGFLEDKLKTLSQGRITRGKVEMFVSVNNIATGNTVVEINKEFTESYIAALKQLSKEYKIKNDITVSKVAQNANVFNVVSVAVDEETLSETVLSAANKALDVFIEMRQTEGERLKNDLLGKIETIKENVKFVEARSPDTVKQYRAKLEQKIKELLDSVQIDEQRILTETAIFADKVAVDEETVRLHSHMKQFCDMLEAETAVGRKLDFIVQEMNREVNTMGSKAQDTEILQKVVDMKSEIEKIREQIQNIE